jgi:hypothetical protein
MLYLGFVVNPIVNIHVVIFCVKTLFSQLDGEDGGCMFFLKRWYAGPGPSGNVKIWPK